MGYGNWIDLSDPNILHKKHILFPFKAIFLRHSWSREDIDRAGNTTENLILTEFQVIVADTISRFTYGMWLDTRERILKTEPERLSEIIHYENKELIQYAIGEAYRCGIERSDTSGIVYDKDALKRKDYIFLREGRCGKETTDRIEYADLFPYPADTVQFLKEFGVPEKMIEREYLDKIDLSKMFPFPGKTA